MKKCACLLLLIVVIAMAPELAFSQDDETRQGTGLPTRIGENAGGSQMNISGKITLAGLEKLKQKPKITVLVTYEGAPVERATANDAGIYLVRNVPRKNVIIVIEVDNSEVARQMIAGPAMGNPRFDLTIPWPMAASAKPAVISASQLYSRNEKNEDLFQKAAAAIKANESAKASELFNQILTADPKDFVAWTELGTIFFKGNALDNAEACYFKAIDLKKDYFVALMNLGKLYVNRKQFDNAILVLSNAVASNPDSADAHYFLGESYLQTKKGSLAVAQLNEAIRLEPGEKAELHLRLATLYDAAGMKSKAANEYKVFLGKRPDYAEKSKLEKYIADNH